MGSRGFDVGQSPGLEIALGEKSLPSVTGGGPGSGEEQGAVVPASVLGSLNF